MTTAFAPSLRLDLGCRQPHDDDDGERSTRRATASAVVRTALDDGERSSRHATASAVVRTALVTAAITASLLLGAPLSARSELSVPRLVYPGTYANYCGPTPEVAAAPGGCAAHGWRGDAPLDRVDEACMRHDLKYCACEAALQQRTSSAAAASSSSSSTPWRSDKLLSALTALRSTGLTARALSARGVDSEYLACARRADEGLIADGLRIRGESQRAGCAAPPSTAGRPRAAGGGASAGAVPAAAAASDTPRPSAVNEGGSEDAARYQYPPWFCALRSETLARIERVDFDLFLSDLDWDAAQDGGASASRQDAAVASRSGAAARDGDGARRTTAGDAGGGLLRLERRRRALLNGAVDAGVPLPRAAASPAIRDLESRMIERL